MSVFIIAEAGVNHNGDMELAKQLIGSAAEAGCDAVKFQTFSAGALVTKDAAKAAYQEMNDGAGSQFDMLKRLELSWEQYEVLKSDCANHGIEFLSTGFSIEDLEFLIGIGIQRIKIPSGDLTNLPILKVAARSGLPILLSTGMADLDEVKASLNVLQEAGCAIDRITALHCTSLYPAPAITVNLRAMQTIQESCRVAIGYSDHTLGDEITIAAVALGATVIEKHITISRDLPGPDHRASLEPDQLKAMVRSIRAVELALGDGIKKPSKKELETRIVARRSIVAATSIESGELLSPTNMACKRPGHGLSPMLWDQLLGRRASRSYCADDIIEEL
jgi:N-acetylneuraminate synthase